MNYNKQPYNLQKLLNKHPVLGFPFIFVDNKKSFNIKNNEFNYLIGVLQNKWLSAFCESHMVDQKGCYYIPLPVHRFYKNITLFYFH